MIGLVLILIGLLIRLVSIRHMGEFSLAINYTSKIVDTGIYKYVRHPAYIGSFIMITGMSLISIHFALLYMVFIFFLSRAIQEESMLSNNGDYQEYRKRTGMLIPKLRTF